MVFVNERLEKIMTDLQRWYDFDVFYANPSVQDMRFTIDILKYDDISKVLNLIEKMEKRMEMLDNRCRQEGKRLFEARYYGSAALKDILENSDEFSDLVEPDEDGAPPGALRENEEAGQ